jgi:hypothetical protein
LPKGMTTIGFSTMKIPPIWILWPSVFLDDDQYPKCKNGQIDFLQLIWNSISFNFIPLTCNCSSFLRVWNKNLYDILGAGVI